MREVIGPDDLGPPEESPGEQIKLLNKNLERVIDQLGRMHSVLVKIELNTKRPPNFGSSYSR